MRFISAMTSAHAVRLWKPQMQNCTLALETTADARVLQMLMYVYIVKPQVGLTRIIYRSSWNNTYSKENDDTSMNWTVV